jgi:hypothetical protein
MERFGDKRNGEFAWAERCVREAERELLDGFIELATRTAVCRGAPEGGLRFSASALEAHRELAEARTGLELAQRAERDGAVERTRVCLGDARLHARRACRMAQAAAAELGEAPMRGQSLTTQGA